MQLVAGRLDDEQIASLAVYFSSLHKNKHNTLQNVICINSYICDILFVVFKYFLPL